MNTDKDTCMHTHARAHIQIGTHQCSLSQHLAASFFSLSLPFNSFGILILHFLVFLNKSRNRRRWAGQKRKKNHECRHEKTYTKPTEMGWSNSAYVNLHACYVRGHTHTHTHTYTHMHTHTKSIRICKQVCIHAPTYTRASRTHAYTARHDIYKYVPNLSFHALYFCSCNST